MEEVEGTKTDVEWVGYDSKEWRKHEDPEGDKYDNDEDRPTPVDVVKITGIDPDKDW